MRHLMLLVLCASAACAAVKPELPDAFQAHLSQVDSAGRLRGTINVRWSGGTGEVTKASTDRRAQGPVAVPLARADMAALWRVCRNAQPWRLNTKPDHDPRSRSMGVQALAGGEVWISRFLTVPATLPASHPLAPLVREIERIDAATPAVANKPSKAPLPGLPDELTVEYSVDGPAAGERRAVRLEMIGGTVEERTEEYHGRGGAGGLGHESPARLVPLWAAIRAADPFALGERPARVDGPVRHTLAITTLEAGRTRAMRTVWAGGSEDRTRVKPVLDALDRIHPLRAWGTARPGGYLIGGAGGGSGGRAGVIGPAPQPLRDPTVPDFSLRFERTVNLTGPPLNRAELVAQILVTNRWPNVTYATHWQNDGSGNPGGAGMGGVDSGARATAAWRAIERAGLLADDRGFRSYDPIRLKCETHGPRARTVRLSWPSFSAVPPALRPLVEDWTRQVAGLP